jgi:hypothetical protein
MRDRRISQKKFCAVSSFTVHFIDTSFQAGGDTILAVSTAYSRAKRNEAVETALTLLFLGTGLKAGVNDTSDYAGPFDRLRNQ